MAVLAEGGPRLGIVESHGDCFTIVIVFNCLFVGVLCVLVLVTMTVPFIHFTHETTVSRCLYDLGEWESLQTEMLQMFLRPGDVVRSSASSCV